MALFIDYGLVTGQRAPEDLTPWTDVYDDVVAVAVAVETAGFDGLWVSEHHFTDDGYMSGLFPVLGALANATTSLTLGTNVALAPLYNPLRLAEDAAVVDLLSHGRFLLGLAIGYRDEEFSALGVRKRERVARLQECVEVCRKAWTGERFSHHRGQRPRRPTRSGHATAHLARRLGGCRYRARRCHRRRLHLARGRSRRHHPACRRARPGRRARRPRRSTADRHSHLVRSDIARHID
jgi:alkanesulfonate monooxygenase SsuD/methylene tetrahydromethanopterin reductase-like flavin-dependent oxidoreductase (luciferase family)